jgi:hypothetical protein
VLSGWNNFWIQISFFRLRNKNALLWPFSLSFGRISWLIFNYHLQHVIANWRVQLHSSIVRIISVTDRSETMTSLFLHRSLASHGSRLEYPIIVWVADGETDWPWEDISCSVPQLSSGTVRTSNCLVSRGVQILPPKNNGAITDVDFTNSHVIVTT